MRAFIIMCFVTVACADQLGYNYQPVGHSDSGLSFRPGASIGSANLSPSIDAGVVGSGINSGAPTGPAGSSESSGLETPTSNNGAPQADLQKEFYTFSAPDSEFEQTQDVERAANSLNRALRVIFIRTPENRAVENAALALARQAADQQIAIYVLNRQPDIADLTQRLNMIRSNINQRPEVHFVKYRTPEDAANAQNAIQNQYDSLGGSSQSHDGGVAPVLNFASSAAVPQTYAAKPPSSSYLPSSILRKR